MVSAGTFGSAAVAFFAALGWAAPVSAAPASTQTHTPRISPSRRAALLVFTTNPRCRKRAQRPAARARGLSRICQHEAVKRRKVLLQRQQECLAPAHDRKQHLARPAREHGFQVIEPFDV